MKEEGMPKFIRHPAITIEMHRETIDVTTSRGERVADHGWFFVDSHGHDHRFAGDEIPTIEWVVTGTEWGGDEYESFEYDVGEYRCRECADVVTPHWNIDYSPKFIPGLLDVTIKTDDGRTYFCRHGEIDALQAAADREAAALEIVASRDPDEWRVRDPA